MERDVGDLNPDVLRTRVNSRYAAPFIIKPVSQRKNLFIVQGSQEDSDGGLGVAHLRKPGPGSASGGYSKMASPADTRIPRPAGPQTNSHPRRPFTIADAYRMAEEEEAAATQGSPSPAPRPWRGSSGSGARESSDKRMQEILKQKPLDLRPRGQQHDARRKPSRDDTISSTSSIGSVGSRKSDVADGGHGNASLMLLEQYEEDQRRMEDVMSGTAGIFNKTKVGPKVAEAGKELARKASSSSLQGTPPARGSRSEWGSRAQPNKDWLKRAMSETGPAGHGAGNLPAEQANEAAAGSPEKSFGWQMVDDFTAGDLQVSQSPPVKSGRTNRRLDEIRALEVESDRQFNHPQRRSPSNTKLDEIRALEDEAARKFPDEPRTTGESAVDRRWSGQISANTSKEIDRAREIEGISRKGLATTRLDELRDRDPARRSKSPQDTPQPEETSHQRLTGKDEPAHEQTVLEEEGEQVPNTPVTIYRKPTEGRAKEDSQAKAGAQRKVKSESPEDSRDLLRRLARAASSSPVPEKQPESKAPGNPVERLSSLRGKPSNPDIVVGDGPKPSVSFSNLRNTAREGSAESNSDKRSSMAVSESDPIERIEGEMKLFAPMESHSERDSLRAPSPESDENENNVEETPRPAPRTDPLALPTPKVIGAYVETPATAKPETADDSFGPALPQPDLKENRPSTVISSFLRGRRANSSPRKSLSRQGRASPRPASSSSTHRRVRSTSRTRVVRNSAKIPSVKDDLLAIHRANQIEDSTLDDLGDLLAAYDDSPASDTDVKKSHTTKQERPSEERAVKEEPVDREKEELDTYDRMTKSLKSGLLDIRSAKQGIERLEDTVSHASEVPKPDLVHTPHHHATPSPTCPHCAALPPSRAVAYIHLPVPRLYHRHPAFRLTLLGVLVLAAAAWLLAESTACAAVCRPAYCAPGAPCDWSPDDPRFGAALPVTLDRWATGGRVRHALFESDDGHGGDGGGGGDGGADGLAALVEALGDVLADAWDLLRGRDLGRVDVQALPSWRERKRLRRRLRRRGLLREPAAAARERERDMSETDRAKLADWRAVHAAQKRAEEARSMGFDVGDGTGEESMSADEKVQGWW